MTCTTEPPVIVITVYEPLPAKVDGSTDSKEKDMRCSIRDCLGEYEERRILHTERHDGKIIVIDGVPAQVCSICGDVLLSIDTVRRTEAIVREAGEPGRTAPVYEYV